MRFAKPVEKRWQLKRAGRQAACLPRRIGYLAKLAVGIFFMNLREAAGRIIRSARRMLDACREIEPKFLEMGDVLQVFYADLDALIRRVKEVTSRLGGEEEENLMEKATDLSSKASLVLERYCRQAADNLEAVDALVSHLKNLHSASDRIDQIATSLRVVGINIGVECTRSEAAREMFRIVAEEIIAFSDSIVSAGRQIREDAREAVTYEENTRDEISAGLVELKQLSMDAAEAIQVSVSEAESCMAIARDVFADSGKQFEEILSQVGEIVAAIQFHDSMRQRLEHVAAVLGEVGGRVLGRPGLLGVSASGMFRLGATNGLIAVQTGQIRDVIEEIERVHRQSTRAFEKMKAEVKHLAQGMLSVCHMGGRNGGDDPFVRYIRSLRHLVSMIDRADKLASIIDDSVTMAVDIAKRFSRHLQKLEKIGVDTHFKAINAIIKSDHLGSEGRTLEVLAQEMNAISRETDRFVLFMKKGLGHVSDFADTLHRSGKESAVDSPPSGRLEENDGITLGRRIEEISVAQVQLNGQVQGAAGEAERLVSGIQNTMDNLVFLPDLADEMGRYLEQLEQASAPFRSFGREIESAADSDISGIEASYTMQRERDVHEAIVSGGVNASDLTMWALSENPQDEGASAGMAPGSPEVIAADDSAPMAFEEEELGDNVELF